MTAPVENTLVGIASTLARVAGVSSTLRAVKKEHASDTMMAPTERAPAAPVLSEPPADAATRPRYEPVGVLGAGGMGRVDHVRDRDLLRDVAVKHLLPEHLANEQLLQQFLWEARVTAYLDHPNIVPVHDLGVTPERHLFFTMKLVKGQTLEAELARPRDGEDGETGPSSLQRRLRLFLQLCHAMSFAHARGVLHRDLKPANVMLGEFGEVLVTDWGIAIPLPNAAGLALRELLPEGASVGGSAGTPAYMSPEQIRGDALDARSDLYTLGVILYELVALAPAFDAKTVPLILKKVQEGDVAPLRSVVPGVSTAVAAVVAKAMALDPAKRYASVKELADDIEIVLDGRTPHAEAAPLVKQAARFYHGRDPALARLRVVDIDLWMIACHFFGAAGVLVLSRWIAIPWYLCVPAIVIGVGIGLRPTLRWMRFRREGAPSPMSR